MFLSSSFWSIQPMSKLTYGLHGIDCMPYLRKYKCIIVYDI